MKRARVIWAFAAVPLLAGCVIEPFSAPMPVPARYWASSTQPAPYQPATYRVGEGATQTIPTVVATRPAETRPTAIDLAARDQMGQMVLSNILKRYPASKDAGLRDYLVLVGSVIALKVPQMEGDLDYVLLETDRPVSGAIAPRTIFVSRGLLGKMEDESELAGVLAREITNLIGNRAFTAAGLTIAATPRPASQPSTRPAATMPALERPATRLVATKTAAPTTLPAALESYPARIVEMLLSGEMGPEHEQTADIEGARLVAEARYAPDGYLRLLTRLDPPKPGTPQWNRVKALEASLTMIMRAHPNADVKLPVRFEAFVKTGKQE